MCGYMQYRVKFLAKKKKKENDQNGGSADDMANQSSFAGVEPLIDNVASNGEDEDAMIDWVNQMKSVVIDDNTIESIKMDFFTNVNLVCLSSRCIG